MDLTTNIEHGAGRPSHPDDDDRTHAPTAGWREMQPSDHSVQFYEHDDTLVDTVAGFFGAGLETGDSCILIATPEHRDGVAAQLTACGFDLAAARAHRRLVSLDAADCLSQFMVDGSPVPDRFHESVGRVVARTAVGASGVRAFGEMVALLWRDGNYAAALQLEELWNELARSHAFSLLCAYAMSSFGSSAHAAPFADICTRHARVIPAESYSALDTTDERLREITLLQQKARSLEAEIAHRMRVEQSLRERLHEIEVLNVRLQRSTTEAHHRVKNSLQLVSALIDVQKSTNRDTVPMSELVRLGASIRALGVVHDILTRQSRDGAEQDDLSVKEVLDQLLSMLQHAAGDRRLTSACDDVRLACRQVTSLALVVNELVSNALKYGKRDVQVTVRVSNSAVTLEVLDDGPGFPETFQPAKAAHTGLELVESAVRWDLNGTTCYTTLPGGGCVVVSFPVTPP